MFSNMPDNVQVMSITEGERKKYSTEEIVNMARERATEIVAACGPQDSVKVAMSIVQIVASIVADACGKEAATTMLQNGNEFVGHIGVMVMDENEIGKA